MANLLITCFIVGPNERPPLHSADEDFDPDGSLDEDAADEVLSCSQLIIANARLVVFGLAVDTAHYRFESAWHRHVCVLAQGKGHVGGYAWR